MVSSPEGAVYIPCAHASLCISRVRFRAIWNCHAVIPPLFDDGRTVSSRGDGDDGDG